MKVLIVLFVLFAAVVLGNRQRLFVRDPLAEVERNGVKVEGAEVYINFSNDVVVQEPRPPNRYIVQHWNLRPGVPQRLSCVRWMFCWTEADRAESVPLGGDARDDIGDDPRSVLRRRCLLDLHPRALPALHLRKLSER